MQLIKETHEPSSYCRAPNRKRPDRDLVVVGDCTPHAELHGTTYVQQDSIASVGQTMRCFPRESYSKKKLEKKRMGDNSFQSGRTSHARAPINGDQGKKNNLLRNPSAAIQAPKKKCIRAANNVHDAFVPTIWRPRAHRSLTCHYCGTWLPGVIPLHPSSGL